MAKPVVSIRSGVGSKAMKIPSAKHLESFVINNMDMLHILAVRNRTFITVAQAKTTQVVAMYLTPDSRRAARCSWVQKGGKSTRVPRWGGMLTSWNRN